MAKYRSEQPGAFSISGRVVHVEHSVARSSGARVSQVVVETADQSESAIIDVHSDHSEVCKRGNWITVDYHLDRKDNKIADSFSRVDTALVVDPHSDSIKEQTLAEAILLARNSELHLAAAHGRLDDLKTALGQGADVNYPDPMGSTAAHLSAFNGRHDCLQVLIDAGARIDARDIHGQTLAHEAAFRGHRLCLETLAKAGAELDATNLSGNTPAMVGVDHPDCLRFLISRGSDMGRINKKGESAMDLATDQESMGALQAAQQVKKDRKAVTEAISTKPSEMASTAAMATQPRARRL